MTGHLARLATRAVWPAATGVGGLRPRALSLFERPGAAPGLMDEYAVGSAAGVNPPMSSWSGAATRPAAEGEPPVAAEPDSGTEPRPGSQVVRAPVGPGPADTATTTGAPAPSPTRPGRRPSPEPVARGPLVEQVTEVVAQVVAQQDARYAHRPSTAGQGVPRPVSAPLAGRTRAEASSTDVRAADSPGVTAAAVGGVVPANGQTLARQGDRSGVAAQPTPLPRLAPAPDTDEKPGVTVNIGRIEVVPPAKAERPAPRPAPKRKSAAPGLADYLRDRSRR